MVTDRTEMRVLVRASVEVEVWTQHPRIDATHPGPVSPVLEVRKLVVSLDDQLDSSDQIREAFARLAEIAVQGATRPRE